MRSLLALVLLLLLAPLCVVADTGCSPAVRDQIVKAIPEAARGTCVLLRMLSDDGTVKEVCAGVDLLAPLLAPLVDELLAQKKDARAQGALVSFALPPAEAPKKKNRPRRHCVEWIEVSPIGDAGDDTPYRDAAP